MQKEHHRFIIKLINENVQITHDRLITLENRTAMMAKTIIPVLKDFKQQINNTNDIVQTVPNDDKST